MTTEDPRKGFDSQAALPPTERLANAEKLGEAMEQKVENKEISMEEFLDWSENEGNVFKKETAQELDSANTVGLEQSEVEEIKKETNVEQDLNEVNQKAENILDEAKKEFSSEQTLEEIQNSHSFNDLMLVIEKSNGIQGSQEFFTPEMLKDVIERVKMGQSNITDITRSGGLREKVYNLLQEEKNLNNRKEGEKGPEIRLPNNESIKHALQVKLEEYRQRLNQQMAKNPYKAPEFFTDTIYKIAVAEKLLADGVVDTYALSRELNKKYGGLDAKTFENASGVIDDYVTTGGKGVKGSTGFSSSLEQPVVDKIKSEPKVEQGKTENQAAGTKRFADQFKRSMRGDPERRRPE